MTPREAHQAQKAILIRAKSTARCFAAVRRYYRGMKNMQRPWPEMAGRLYEDRKLTAPALVDKVDITGGELPTSCSRASTRVRKTTSPGWAASSPGSLATPTRGADAGRHGKPREAHRRHREEGQDRRQGSAKALFAVMEKALAPLREGKPARTADITPEERPSVRRACSS